VGRVNDIVATLYVDSVSGQQSDEIRFTSALRASAQPPLAQSKDRFGSVLAVPPMH